MPSTSVFGHGLLEVEIKNSDASEEEAEEDGSSIWSRVLERRLIAAGSECTADAL